MNLQFGQPDPGHSYHDRPTAFGLVFRDGRLACVRVDRGEGSYYDLPGGAIDGDETEEQALVREFVEETGLTVRARDRLGEAGQYFLKSDGRAVNNLAGFWTADVEREDPAAKVEDDHELHWLDPHQALAALRHDAHAWAVALWLRRV
ncbi:MAG: NUDIX domain-containing protein [Brevundimonas sp.]